MSGSALPVAAAGLSEAEIARLLAERARAFSAPSQASQETGGTFTAMVWRTGAARHACAIEHVRAVVPRGKVTRVPGAPPHMIGLIERGGEVYNLFDPAPYLDQTTSADFAQILILRRAWPRVALAVSAMEGLVQVARDLADAGANRFIDEGEGPAFTFVDLPPLIERLLAGSGTT